MRTVVVGVALVLSVVTLALIVCATAVIMTAPQP